MYDKELVNSLPEEVLNIFFRLERYHHIMSLSALEKDKETYVEVVFTHYVEVMRVYLKVNTLLGEVNNVFGEDDEETIGVITLDKLEELLSKLPHVCDYLEDVGKESILH